MDRAALTPPASHLAAETSEINKHFGGETFRDILRSLDHEDGDWTDETIARLNANAPLAMAATVEIVHRARARDRIDEALRQEYRFAHRIVEMGDFQEGIRAAIIDRDKTPAWRHDRPDAPAPAEVSAMLQPLGQEDLRLEDQA